jgi:hypothetical protein
MTTVAAPKGATVEPKSNTSSVSESANPEFGSIEPVGESANPEFGFIKANRSLRSVVAHPLGLPLAALLNDVPIDDTFNVLAGREVPLTAEKWMRETLPDSVDEMYSKAFKKCGGKGEVPLTKSLVENIKAAGIPVEAEKVIDGSDAGKSLRGGRFDFMIGYSKMGGQKPVSVVTLVEVGMGIDNWWKKTDQIVTYAEMLVSSNGQNESEFCISKPSLIAIIAIDECDQLSPPKKELDTKARFGVFLCWNRDSEIRLALLWRVQTTGVDAASHAFGKLLRATQMCAQARLFSKPLIDYVYLGPNCCRIGGNVSRRFSVEDMGYVA